MKKFNKFLSLILALGMSIGVCALAACGGNGGGKEPEEQKPAEVIDFASGLKLDFTTNSLKQEVEIKMFVDGDTTHFWPKESTMQGTVNGDFSSTENYIKARYLAINTPESTGKIEEWGKKASNFTKSKLKNAKAILVESDDDHWNPDSTGERYLLWVWYIPENGTEYRNLNIEILQEGLAVGSSTSSNRYGEIGMAAITQAMDLKLYVWSGEKDPEFYYGEAIAMTIKELRCHIEDYVGIKVSFEGVVVGISEGTAYMEEYDDETGLYFGMTVYPQYAEIPAIEDVGNRARIVGTVQFWEPSGAYQVSGLSWRHRYPNDPNNTIRLDNDYHEPNFQEISAKTLMSESQEFTFITEKDDGTAETEKVTLPVGEAVMSSSVSLKGLYVYGGYNSAKNEVNLKCRASDGTEITVHTGALTKKVFNEETQKEETVYVSYSEYVGHTIDVQGIVSLFNNKYQVYSYKLSHLTIVK